MMSATCMRAQRSQAVPVLCIDYVEAGCPRNVPTQYIEAQCHSEHLHALPGMMHMVQGHKYTMQESRTLSSAEDERWKQD